MTVSSVLRPAALQETSDVLASTRLLMCAPTAYALKYEINPWMSLTNIPDLALAERQWNALYHLFTAEIGVTVELIPQAEECPDMVFTANAGLVRGQFVLLSNFRHPQRQVEVAPFRAWFESKGYEAIEPPEDVYFEGEGDALFALSRLGWQKSRYDDAGVSRWRKEFQADDRQSMADPYLPNEQFDHYGTERRIAGGRVWDRWNPRACANQDL